MAQPSEDSSKTSEYHDIYLYIAPIEAQNDFKLHKPFRPVAHWAICVDGRCFELERKDESNIIKRDYHLLFLAEKAWKDIRAADGRLCEKGRLGRTQWSREDIEKCVTADAIWGELFKRDYSLWQGQDCQNFAQVLTECIGDETAIEKFDTFTNMLEIGYSFQAGFVGAFGASISMLSVPDPTLTTQTLGTVAAASSAIGAGAMYVDGWRRSRARKKFVAKWRR